MTPKVFRTMKRDGSANAPAVEQSARGLGVRPQDLTPCALGLAHPGRGGMSVAPTLRDLPRHRVPARLGRLVEGASGPDTDCVWALGQEGFVSGPLLQGLVLRTTNSSHGLIEPDAQRPFGEYAEHLAGTANQWVVEES